MMYVVHDEDHEAVVRASVAVDDDPEETVGRETVGRTRRGRKIRGLEEFRKNLPPFWKNLNRPCPSRRNFFEDNSIYFESAQRSAYRLGPFFSGMLTGVVKIFETSPHSVGEGGAGLFTNTLY